MCQFSTLGRSANVYVIYKGNIPATAVQLPLLFRVTSAKLSKYPEFSRANRKNPAVFHNRAGHKHMNYTSFIHTLMDNLRSFEDYMNR